MRIKKVKQAQQDVPIAELLESGPEQLQGEDEEMKPVWIGYETNYLYDGQMPVCEQDFEDGVLKQTRIHLLGARGIEGIITVPSNGSPTLNWLFYDGHGNMVRTMSTSFALSGFQWQGVWGERTNSTPGRGYCANLGHPEDETGLVYMRARYYEPGTGRFISEDPARDGVNWYLYADGNAVNKVDASGESAEDDLGMGFLFSVLALGILSLTSTLTIGNLEFSKWIGISNSLATTLATIAMIYFARAFSGLADASQSERVLYSRVYLAAAAGIVQAFQQAGKLTNFATAGIAVGAAFTYALLLTALIHLNEFEGGVL